MADDDRPLLRGRIVRSEKFRDPRSPVEDEISLPPRDAPTYKRRILAELDAVAAAAARTRDEDASRVVVVAVPVDSDLGLPAESLGDKRSDARVVGQDPESKLVLIDFADPRAPHLRRKLEDFADDGKIADSGNRRNEPLFARLEHIRVPTHEELAGPEARELPDDDAEKRWFEIGCRGGARGVAGETLRTQSQMRRQLSALGVALVAEYQATEQLVFFVNASVLELGRLVRLVDCVFEYELAPPDVRDWLIFERQTPGAVQNFSLLPPPTDAPAVALLDTGVATQHPLLQSALRHVCSVVPGDSSPEDTHDHGTETAGIALYPDLGLSLARGTHAATHWLDSARLLSAPRVGSAEESERSYWPRLTEDAVEVIERAHPDTPTTYCMTVTAPISPIRPTFWSHALDRLAYNDGQGRLFCVSAGNADVGDTNLLAGYPQLSLQQPVHDPAQAANVVTVGAFTTKTRLPPEPVYASLQALAPEGGVSPYTSAGDLSALGRPDISLEGGNLAFDGQLPGTGIETLSALTTSRRFLQSPLSLTWGTSEAVAHAARIAALVWAENPGLRPETVRGLLVHSASWSSTMVEQFPNLDERMRVCGYGVPDLDFARECARGRATIVVEDTMPNGVVEYVPKKKKPKRPTTPTVEPRVRRLAKFFRLPVPQLVGFANDEQPVELRVTLSYFGEPNTFRGRVSYGLGLRWDMQGPRESEDVFRERINRLARTGGRRTRKSESFRWTVKINRRGRGTVQSDRWAGEASELAGPKLIAVMPVLGWWSRRKECELLEQPFSLIVSISAPGMDIYSPIQSALALPTEIEAEV